MHALYSWTINWWTRLDEPGFCWVSSVEQCIEDALKISVYENPVDSDMGLVARLVCDTAEIKQNVYLSGSLN